MTVKKKLAVCGCSFMWSSKDDYDSIKSNSWDKEFPINETIHIQQEKNILNYQHWPHFTDIFGKENNYQVYNYAQGAATNLEIRQQIDSAVLIEPDLIVIGATDPNRSIIKNKNNQNISSSFINNKEFFTESQITAYKMYISFIHSAEASAKQSYYMLQNGLQILEKKQVAYVFLPGPMKSFDWTAYSIVWPDSVIQPWDLHLTKKYSMHGNHYDLDQQYIFFENMQKILDILK